MNNNQFEKDYKKSILLKSNKKLVLRTPVPDDAEKMIQYLNTVGGESDNLLFGKDEFRLTAEQERAYIENIDQNTFMMVGLIDNEIVSVAQISSSGRKRIAHNAEIAISVLKKCWHFGIGSAVMQELLAYAKNKGSIKNIHLGVRDGNENAVHLYEKFGFQKTGRHKNFFNVNGNYYDEILMDFIIAAKN